MVSQHIELIDALGGPKALSDTVRRKTGRHITPQAISQWKVRGIAWRHRGLIEQMAVENEIPVPPNFSLA